jgi:hypothetical protein
MKTLLLTISLGFLTARILADTGTNLLSTELAQAQVSGDANRIVAALPNAEKLWTQDPKEYFEFMRGAAKSLGDKDVQLLLIYTNVLSKPVSTNYQMVVDTLEIQANTAWSCAGALERSGHKKSDLLVLARFMGKIQDQIIPDYQPQGAMLSGQFSQKEIDDNEKNKITDNWQRALGDNKRRLEFLLFSIYSDRSDTNFTEQIISAAQLSSEESQKLRSGARTPNH